MKNSKIRTRNNLKTIVYNQNESNELSKQI